MIQASVADETRQALWSHAALQVVLMSCPTLYECSPVGIGWGVRNPQVRRRAILVHPSADPSVAGELSLTVPGLGTRVLPRDDRSYVEYLASAVALVSTTTATYLSPK